MVTGELSVTNEILGQIELMLKAVLSEALKGDDEQYERDELRKALEAVASCRSRIGPKLTAETKRLREAGVEVVEPWKN